MSSYYLDTLFSKYTAAGCFFPNAERSSCRSGPSGEDCGFAWLVHLPRGFYNNNNLVYHSPPFFFFFLQRAMASSRTRTVTFLTAAASPTAAVSRSREPNLANGQANPHLPLDESIRQVFFLLQCYLTTLVAF